MADTITLPSGLEVIEGRVLVIPGIGVVMPESDLTPTEVAALRADVASVLGMGLDDLADVMAASPADGDALLFSAGQWQPGAPLTGIKAFNSSTLIRDEVKLIVTGYGLEFSVHPTDGAVFLLPVYGGTGSANSFSRSDHLHPPTLKGRFTFDKAAAVLGAGSSSLVNQSVSGLVPGVIYDVDITGRMEAVNTNLSGRLYLRTKIGTQAYQDVSRGFSGGVWTEVAAGGYRMGVTGGTSLQLQFEAQYQSGDPTALYAGELEYSITPRGGQ